LYSGLSPSQLGTKAAGIGKEETGL